MSDVRIPDSELVDDQSTISPTPLDVMRVLRQAIARASRLPLRQIRPGNENVPPPNGTYGTLEPIGDSSPVGSDAWTAYSDIPGDDEHVQVSQYRDTWGSFDLQFYGAGAFELAKSVRIELRGHVGSLWLDERGYVVIRIGQARELTHLFRERHEERAGVDLRVKWEERITARVEAITDVVIAGGLRVDLGGRQGFDLDVSVDDAE